MNKIIVFFAVSLISLTAFFVFRISVSSVNTEVVKKVQEITSENLEISTPTQPIPTIAPTVTPTFEPSFSPTASVDPKPAEKQILKATYSWGKGLWPTEFTVKAGIPVRFGAYAEIDGFGCMGSIMIPYLSDSIQNFVKGQTNVFEFTPEKPGVYEITCAMGIPHASITVK